MTDTNNSSLAVIPRIFGNIEYFLVYIAPKGKIFAGQYRFVGGKILIGENYISTLEREFLEEYGVSISKINLLHIKNNVLNGEIFLCSGFIKGEPVIQSGEEKNVGEPEWKSAKELFSSNLVPNCKIALYCYLLKNNLEELNSIISIIKKDNTFISFLKKEAEELHSDLFGRIRINSK